MLQCIQCFIKTLLFSLFIETINLDFQKQMYICSFVNLKINPCSETDMNDQL